MLLLLLVFRRCGLLCAIVMAWAVPPVAAQVQAPIKQWDRSFGGNDYEGLAMVQPTTDGGHIMGGWSNSGISGDKSQASRGRVDYWIVKTDANGNRQWDRTFGGDKDDYLASIQQTADGGYMLAGSSDSGVSGDRTALGHANPNGLSDTDFWLVKLDAQGLKQWDRAYGGNDTDDLNAMQQTADGGYLLGGKTYSPVSGDKTQPSRGYGDFWLIKVDAQGTKQWDRTLGGDYDDALNCLQQTSDGGYIIGGWSNSSLSGDRTQPNKGSNDYWIIKLNGQGAILWDRAYGGNNSDLLHSVQQTQDGGYILGGESDSDVSGDKSHGHYGNNSGYNYDFWVVKTDAVGTLQWEHTYGGVAIERLHIVRQTTDQGYILGGVSSSDISIDKSQPIQGTNNGYDFDYWVLKLNAGGTKQWDRSYGAGGDDYLYSLQQTGDGGFMLGGTASSGTSSDRLVPGHGSADFWVVKLAGAPAPPPVLISGDSLLCANQPVTLLATASPAPTTYRWSTGATTSSVVVTQPGTYTVVATFSSGLTSTAQYRVRASAAMALPPFALGPDTTLCEGATLLLHAPPQGSSSGVTRQWSDGSIGTSLLVRESGIYSLQLNSACNSRTASRTITFAPCLTIPNVITPTGDERNERFVIGGLGTGPWALTIYNRWGKKVYETTKYQNDWGDGIAPGPYFYTLRSMASAFTYKGWLEVVR